LLAANGDWISLAQGLVALINDADMRQQMAKAALANLTTEKT
jgi:hypothetical protein